MEKSMSILKMYAQTMSAWMNNTLTEQMIEAYLREAFDDVKATAEIKTDETIEFETWSEVSSTEKEASEKVGETFDLRQATMDFE